MNNILNIATDSHKKRPELWNMKLLLWINIFLFLASYLLPQYFGIHIGWDLTSTRLANLLLIFYALLNKYTFNLFTNSFFRCPITIPFVIYLFVAFYTMVLRVDINAFMLVFFEVLTFYMMLFSVRYVIGFDVALKLTLGSAYFLCIYGFVEFAAGHSLYLQFLETMPSNVTNCYRSGFYRIMGPCGHPLGYGLLLIIFIAFSCIDYENNTIYLYKRPILLFMLVSNVFLTGSRSSQAIAALEIICIIAVSNRTNRIKAVVISLFLIMFLAVFLLLMRDSRIGKYVLMQITTLIDQLFDTSISMNFGADMTTLDNSEDYRKFLPYIFKLDWLNPVVGRGVKQSFGAEIVDDFGNVAYIHSVDSYYICQYIKYAYPGLIAYIIIIFTTIFYMIINVIKYKSGILKVLLICYCCYFLNLLWLDALQTLKFIYIVVALFFAYVFSVEDAPKEKIFVEDEL